MAEVLNPQMQRPKLKILFAGVSWPPETFLAQLIKGLVEVGEVTFACWQKPDERWRSLPRFRWLPTRTWEGSLPARLFWLSAAGYKAILRGPKDARLFASRALQEKSWVERLHRWHQLAPFAGQRRHWNLIYFPWNSGAMTYLPLFDLGDPVVVSCRGSQINTAPHNPNRSATREALKATFQRAAAVHCVSKAIEQEARRWGLDPSKACIIHPAVDPDFFCPSEPDSEDRNTFRVLTTGLLTWCKGYEYALQCIRQVLDRGISVGFDIIGDGPERQRILYTVHDLGLERHVRLLGRLDREGVRDHLRLANAFLLSSLSEGISNAALEAMACGLPLVTTDCGGMREAITDGVEGFVVPAREPEAMAEALLRLGLNPQLRRRMGQAARQRIVSQFTLAEQINKFAALCETVLGAAR